MIGRGDQLIGNSEKKKQQGKQHKAGMPAQIRAKLRLPPVNNSPINKKGEGEITLFADVVVIKIKKRKKD